MLKSQNKHRRLHKPFIFILSIILTLSICSLEGFKKPYKASTEIPNYNTTYGSYSLARTMLYSNSLVEQDLFTYSFNGAYNGRMRIYYTATAYNHINSMNFINCYVESKTGTYIQIAFKNQSEIAIIFSNDSAYPMDITSIGDYNMTRIADGVNSQLETLQTILYSIQSTNQTIATNSAGISTTNSQLTTLNTNVNDIETLIRNYFTDNNGVTINIGDIILQFNEFNANLQLQLGILNDLKTALLDIDNKIDTISWVDLNKTISYNPAFSSNWQTMNDVTITFNSALQNWQDDYDRDLLYKLSLPLTCENYNTSLIITFKDNNVTLNNTVLYYTISQYQINIYFTSMYNANSNNLTINIKPNNNKIMFTNPNNIPAKIYKINSNDIEYWELMNLFNQYKYKNEIIAKLGTLTPINYNSKLDDIITAINNVSFVIDDNTVNNTETIIENYNDIYTDIENIEIQFINNFNTTNNNIDKTVFDRTIDISAPKTALETTINSFMSNNYIKNIVYLFLLTIIIIAILG